MTTTENELAVNAYVEQEQRLIRILECVTENVRLNDGSPPAYLHWGHVGDLGRAVDLAEQLAQELGVSV